MRSSIIPKEERSEEEGPSKVDFTLMLPTESLCYKSGAMHHVPVLLLKLDSKCTEIFPHRKSPGKSCLLSYCPSLENYWPNSLPMTLYKIILKLSKSTPSCMVYGELGQFPLEVQAKCRMLNFWFKLVNINYKFKFSNIMYKFLYEMYSLGGKIEIAIFVHCWDGP